MNPGVLLYLALLAPPAATFEAAVDRDVPSYSLAGTPFEKRDRAPSAAFRAAGWVVVGTAVSDLATTHYVLRGGGYEANPLAPKTMPAMMAGKAAATVLSLWLTKNLHDHGHEKAALWIRVATGAAWGYASVHNVRVGNELRASP